MGTLEILSSTLLGGVISAFIPVVSAEVIVVSAATLGPEQLAAPCVLLLATGQMVGKAVLFHVGSGALRIPWLVPAERLRRASARLGDRRRFGDLVLFTSAVTGLPPFYLTTLASGMLGVGFGRFTAVGFSGRLIRFGVLAALPQMALGVHP